MSLADFARKEVRLARQEGVATAAAQGLREAGVKALGPAVDRQSRLIWDGDWDVCLVVDSCRADLWRQVAAEYSGLNADSAAYSVGSCSPEWIARTFSDDYDVSGVGYVTANPFSSKERDGSAYPLRDRGLAYLDEVWADQWGGDMPTVTPAAVTARGRWAWQHRDELGIGRLVVHYMQPHVPFRLRPEWTAGWDLAEFGTGGGRGKNDWKKVRDGELDAGAFWHAYADNLQWAIEDGVLPWLLGSDAKLLVTSDHGNAMGEWGEWGHPARTGNPAVRKVPWVRTVGQGGRPVGAVPGDPPVVYERERDETDVEARLSALGYAEA